MRAVKLERFGHLIFVGAPIPDHLHAIVAELGGVVLEDVRLSADADDLGLRPDGDETPPPVLCVSRSDPTDYRVFRSAADVDRSRWEPTGMNYSLYDADRLAFFLERLVDLDRLAARTDETDTEELWDEMTRELSGVDPGAGR